MVAAVFEVGAALFGACVGSFLNVVIWRLPQPDPQRRSLGGRSHCPACGQQIGWRDNVPVLGWLLLRGRARCCRAAISFRYPFVELLTAIAFYVLAVAPPSGVPAFGDDAVLHAGGLGAFVAHATFVALLIALTFIDFDTQLLPDALTKPGMAVGVVAGTWPGVAGVISHDAGMALPLRALLASLLGLLVGGGVTWGVRALGEVVFRKEAMGFGDVKLMAMIGAFVGWQHALLTLFLGCVFGALVGGLLALRSGFGARIPFGPYLALGAIVALFAGDAILQVLLVDWPEWQAQHPESVQWTLLLGVGALLMLFWLVRRSRRSG